MTLLAQYTMNALPERPPLMRDDDSSDDSFAGTDTPLSAKPVVDWSLTYSSDEESVPTAAAAARVRSFSEPAVESSPFRRRPRSMTTEHAPDNTAADMSEDESSSLSSSSHNHRPSYHHRRRWTPVMCLAVVFFISCYTTFCLPYPEIPPVQHVSSHVVTTTNNNTDSPRRRVALPPLSRTTSGSGGGAPDDHWMHARLGPQQQHPLVWYYHKNDDPMVRFYAQEGFQPHSYARDLNVAMLALVCVWAVWERRQRKKWW